jgi:hypothetical protein
VGADLFRRALGEYRALVQHGDAVGDRHHDLHLVLDHDHRAPRGDALDQGDGSLRLLRAHARGGLVEEQELGRAGQRDGDLEMALQAMAEEGRGQVGLRVELDRAEDLPRRLRDAPQPIGPRPAIHHRAAALDGHPHVLEDREVGEDRGDLIRLGDAAL